MSKNLIDDYTGGEVGFPLVAAALDFIVSIQPASDDPDGGEKYDAAQVEHAQTLRKIELILRTFGASITPPTREEMQEAFYRIVNSRRYCAKPEVTACVSSTLSRAWNGIGEWQH